jgi:hypothetical protein
MNVKRFGEESYLNDEKERVPFRELIKLPLNWRMITVIVDGAKLAFSLAIVYRQTYYYLIIGSDINQVRDVFKYLTKVNLELAIKTGAKIFDAGIDDCKWKDFWHFDKKAQTDFEKRF